MYQQLFWGVPVTEGFDFVSVDCLAGQEYGFVFLVYFFSTFGLYVPSAWPLRTGVPKECDL
jgi:hypothetical protein